jgi:tryptophan synthase alpha chain
MSDPVNGAENGSRPATAPLLAPRLARAFKAPRARRAALMPYLTGGHPDLETCDRLIDTVLQAGADIVELGIPFSDPIADGPVVQRSTHRALLAGVTPDDVFQLAAAHSGAAPFVLLTYLNPVLAYGPDRFFARAASSGVEALVIPDLPVDEAALPDFPPKPPAEEPSAPAEPSSPAARALAAQAAAAEEPDGGLVALAASCGVSLVPMATPTSTEARLDLVAAAATSFVYCVAVTGVTGARSEVGSQLPGLLQRLRARTGAPLAVGFGISTPQQAGAVAGLADGVIIGSALIDAVARAANADEACRAAAGLIQSSSAAIAAG